MKYDLKYIMDNVTIVMTTFYNWDFTNASIWAIRQFYPGIKIIIADGGSADFKPETINLKIKYGNIRFLQIGAACTEDCRNAAAVLVDTPYILFMDNDCKILGFEAIPLLLEAINSSDDIAQTGAYGVKVVDWDNKKAYVGTEFTDHMRLDASPAYFSMHTTEDYLFAGGMAEKPFYTMPIELLKGDLPGYGGDLSITQKYLSLCKVCISPKERVPVLHWSQANRYFTPPRPLEDYWYNKVNHIRISPLNDWNEYERRANGNSK